MRMFSPNNYHIDNNLYIYIYDPYLDNIVIAIWIENLNSCHKIIQFLYTLALMKVKLEREILTEIRCCAHRTTTH